MNRLESVGFINPSGNTKSVGAKKQEFYNKEKEAIKKSFTELGDTIDWMEGAAKKKLETFARKIITTTIDTVIYMDGTQGPLDPALGSDLDLFSFGLLESDNEIFFRPLD